MKLKEINLKNKHLPCSKYLLFKIFKNQFSISDNLKKQITNFQSDLKLEEAYTPPSSWYYDKEFYDYEINRVFKRNWIGIGINNSLKGTNNFTTGEIVGQPFVLIKNQENNQVKGLYNVCSHHASTIKKGSGFCKELECPYHGWTYNLKGELTKCTSMKGIQNFKLKENNLKQIDVDSIGEIYFLHFKNQYKNANQLENLKEQPDLNKILQPFKDSLKEHGYSEDFSDLVFVKSKDYKINCNWKIFIDNYCDGGYHVPYAHKELTSKLELLTYYNVLHPKLSLQITKSSVKTKDLRIGDSAVYACLYPNIMFNRYGPWLDINIVYPLSPTECLVKFEWYIKKELSSDHEFINKCLESSELVQIEDITLCDNVMKGVLSDAYDKGRYIPSKESPLHHFHLDLYNDLKY